MKNAARDFLHFILSKVYKLTPLGKQNKKKNTGYISMTGLKSSENPSDTIL